MVRCLGVLLVLVLLLCGCAGANAELPDNTTQPPNSTEQPAEGLYVLGSSVEKATYGVVKSFKPDGQGYYGCAALSGDLILIQQVDGEGVFSLYEGAELKFVKELRLGAGVVPALEQMQITEQGIGYFDNVNKAMVLVNADLVEIGRVYLPEEAYGEVWLSWDWKNAYYCTEKGIFVIDLRTGIARLLREQNALNQKITGCIGNGKALRYEVEIIEGDKQVLLIDATTGLTLREGENLNRLLTGADCYFWPHSANGIRYLRFGEGENHQVLWPVETASNPYMIFENRAMVMMQNAQKKTKLTYYDLRTGGRIDFVELADVTDLWGMRGDGQQGVWMFGTEKDGSLMLYHWDTEVEPYNDEKIYTAPWYTAESPDTEGLEQLAQDAAALGDKFGVEILVWQDALNAAPVDYVFTAEHSVQVYELYLSKLEELLGIFPENFFKGATEKKLQFALVQDIAGEPLWGGLAQPGHLQFWNDDQPVVALVMSSDMERNFYHGVYLYMDTVIMSKSSALYEWYKLNPDGFRYDNNYTTNLDRTDTSYIEGEDRYFIDLFSMSYAKEDRARIFEYACLLGNEEVFASSVIQDKFQRICKGIRTAFQVKEKDYLFVWEQYLES